MNRQNAENIRRAPLATPSGLPVRVVEEIAGALTLLLADVFALYLKTTNFHWHMSRPRFRDYHLLLDEQADQLFESTDHCRTVQKDRWANPSLDWPY